MRTHAYTEPDTLPSGSVANTYQSRRVTFVYEVPTALDGAVDKLRSLPFVTP